jgi:hypothetical protein
MNNRLIPAPPPANCLKQFRGKDCIERHLPLWPVVPLLPVLRRGTTPPRSAKLLHRKH